jgi:ABC-type multidrug transport system ATPase subunit
VKHADDFLLLAKGEIVLEGKPDRLNDIMGYYGIETNVEKTKTLKATVSSTEYSVLKTTRECGVFQLFG